MGISSYSPLERQRERVSLVEGGRGIGALRVASPAPSARPRPARPPQLRVVTGGAARRRSLARGTAVASVITVAALFGVVVFHVLLNQGQMQLDRLQTRSTQEHARAERLRLDLAALQSPARVVAAARDRLGMVSPAAVAYLVPGRTGQPVPAPAIVPLPAPPVAAAPNPHATHAPPPAPPVPGAIFRTAPSPAAQPAPTPPAPKKLRG
jgi:cell division protein FtsL